MPEPLHLLSADQFAEPIQLDAVFKMADQARDGVLSCRKDEFSPPALPLQTKLVIGFYDEPTTRTGPSFHAATTRAGGSYIGHHAGDSSMRKGESYEDSLKTLSLYGDILVARSSKEGQVAWAAKRIDKPVINAGDGSNEHPTQALLDLYTVSRHFPSINGLTFLLTGDLGHSRTTRSLLKLLRLYDANVVLSYTYQDVMNSSVSKCIPKERLTIISERELPNWLDRADVVYMTRHQAERPGDRPRSRFVMDSLTLPKLKKDAIVLHPLPKESEVGPIDDMPQAKYWEQVENGMWVRMAVLTMIARKAACWNPPQT